MGSLELRKNWILGGYTSVFESKAPLSEAGLSDLVDGCLRTLLPSLHSQKIGTELIDFKGRNPLDELLPGLPRAQKDELFRVGGECAIEELDDGFAWDNFDLCCYSPFARFQGAHHIIHSLELQRTGSLPVWLPPRLIGCAAPIKLRYFRFGLEHFRSRRTFASLGYNPQITESLLIDCHSGTLCMRMTTESDKRAVEDPFEAVPTLKVMAGILRQTSGIDIQSDYMRLLRENW